MYINILNYNKTLYQITVKMNNHIEIESLDGID